jgi:HK97 family phage major capsid protein
MKTENIRQLMAERRALVSQLEALNKRELTPDEQAAWNDLTAKVAELDSRVSTIETAIGADEASEEMPADPAPDAPAPEVQQNSANLEALEKRLAGLLERAEKAGVGRRTAPGFVRDLNDKQSTRDRDLAFRGWLLRSAGRDSDAHKAAAARVGFNLNERNLDVALFANAPRSVKEIEARAQAVGTGSAGGYLVPTTLSENLEKQLLYFANVRQVAQVIRTATGNNYDIPTVDDTGNKGEIISENTAFNNQDVTFSKKTLSAYMYSSKLVLCSLQLLQDSVINVPALLGDLLGERLGRIQADHFTTGTGSSQPEGVVTGSSAGVTAASATAIAVDDLLGLVHSLDRAYRPQAQFMVNDAILLAIRKLKDGQQRPIFTESYIVGEPDRILGYPVIVNNSMDGTMAATKKTVLFGDFSKFVVRDALDIQVIRMDERFGEYGQVAFTAFQRSDSKVLISAAIKRLTH